MKLKKIASLMLAGVMAVSMLAGCSNNGGASSDPADDSSENTSVATYMNDAQAYNDGVQIDFTYDTNMEQTMTRILADNQDLDTTLPRLLNIDSVNYADLMGNGKNYNSLKVGEQTNLFITTDSGKASMTDEAFVEYVVNNDYLDFSGLKDEYLAEDTQTGKIDYNFDYTGRVAMVKDTSDNGIVTRYLAVVITCTTSATVAK